MSLVSWRIVKRQYSDGAFSGEGARIFGGRWNSPGRPVVYTAENASLAVLEVLTHLEMTALLSNFVLFHAEFESALVEEADSIDLPSDWRAYPAPRALRDFGDTWLEEMRTAVLCVPSVIVPIERLYLLNPLHEDFRNITIGEPQEFAVDTRLRKV